MKKHILKFSFVLAVVIAAGYTVYSSQTSLKMTGIALNNVEALASDESSQTYEFVYYPVPGDENYGYTKCVCIGDGDLDCC